MASNKKELKKLKDRILSKINRLKPDMDTLALERGDLLDAYMREDYGNEVEGRSRVVMSDVYETVETIMPTLMRVFMGGNDVVSVKPRRYRGPQDKETARLMEEKINFDFTRANDGYLVLHDFIKDALLLKLGAVKSWWYEEEKELWKEFKGLNEMEFQKYMQHPDFIIDKMVPNVIQEASIDPVTLQPIPAVMTYDISGRHISKRAYVKAECVPPEEFVYDCYSKDIRKMFCAHRKLYSKEEVSAKWGINEDEISDTVNRWETDIEVQKRYDDIKGISFILPEKDSDEVYVYECYTPSHWSKDGRSYIINLMGDTFLDKEPQINKYGRPPFSVQSPIRIPHRVVGQSLAEHVTDLQQIHTSLTRYVLDSIYFQINKRMVLNPFRVDADQFINDNKPGGAVFTLYDIEPTSVFADITPAGLPADTYKMFDYLATLKENRTGISNINPSPVPTQAMYTTTGISQMLSQIQQRIELIARTLAETGIKDMFQFHVDLNCQFFNEPTAIEVNGMWKTIDPVALDGFYDVVVDVGVGTGSKETQIQQKKSMLETYGMFAKMAASMGPMGILTLPYSPENIYNAIKEIWQDFGHKDGEQFCSEPKLKTNEEVFQAIMGQMLQQAQAQQQEQLLGQ